MVKNNFSSPAFKRESWKGQEYDKENIKILRDGKEINLYNLIQESRDDTEIYVTLEKYGSIKPMETNYELVYGDLGDIKDLRDLKEKEIRAQNLWNSLDPKIRNEFNNNKYDFLQNGEQWLINKIEMAKKPVATDEEVTEVKE